MVLSPKAVRFVDMAADQLPTSYRNAWNNADHRRSLPYEAADAALQALVRLEGKFRSELEAGQLSEDDAADMTNDLYFVLAVEGDLRRSVEG
jgi:hypothetical protein